MKKTHQACLWLGLTILLGVFSAVGQSKVDYNALVHQGNAQLQAGNNDLALATAKSAIKLKADRWEAYALAGGALMKLKRYEEAADDFSKAIEHAPEAKQEGLRSLRKQCLAEELGVTSPSASASNTQQPMPVSTTQAEIVLWKSIENSTNPADFQSYLSQYPNGTFAVLAKNHLIQIEDALWKSIENSKNPDDFQSYLQLYPNGKYVSDALIRMADAKKAVLATRLVPNLGAPIPGTSWTFYNFGISESGTPKRTSGNVAELGTNARYVDWSINVSAPKGTAATAEAICEYFDSAGNSVSGKMKAELSLQAKHNEGGSFQQGWGNSNGGSWREGSYQIRCDVNGVPYLRENFVVGPDAVFPLDLQKGVHNTALLLLSDGQLAYTARDYYGMLHVSSKGINFRNAKTKENFDVACSDLKMTVNKSHIKIDHAGVTETLGAESPEDAERVVQTINHICGR